LAAILVTVAVVVLTYLAGKLAYRLRDVILLVVTAGFFALILNPVVVALQRRRIRGAAWPWPSSPSGRCWSSAAWRPHSAIRSCNGLAHFSHQLPAYVRSAETGHGWIGQLIQRVHLQAWVARNAPKLQSRGASLARPALTVGQGAATVLAALGTIFVLVILFLLEGPKMRKGLLQAMAPQRAAYYSRVAGEISQSATGYAFGNLLTSLIAGVVVFVTLTLLGVPFPLLWAVWVALVDFLPMIGGALAGIPTVVFALSQSLTAGLVTAAAFIAYQQVENHVLNPVIMSRTVKVNPLLVLLSVLVGTSIGDWLGGLFGSFVAALIAIPVAGALQVIARELWQATRVAGTTRRRAARRPGAPRPADEQARAGVTGPVRGCGGDVRSANGQVGPDARPDSAGPELSAKGIGARGIGAADGIRFALGEPAPGLAGFRRTHQQALGAQAVALAAGPSGQLVTSFGEVAPLALMSASVELLQAWVTETLGALADEDEHSARLRDTLRVFLQENGSYKTTAERLMLHKNTVQYRVRKAEETLRCPIAANRLHIELALLASHWLGRSVVRPAGEPGPALPRPGA